MEPNRLNLKNGSFILYDTVEGIHRVAYYQRTVGRGNLELAVSKAIGKPIHNTEVKQITKYLREMSSNDSVST